MPPSPSAAFVSVPPPLFFSFFSRFFLSPFRPASSLPQPRFKFFPIFFFCVPTANHRSRAHLLFVFRSLFPSPLPFFSACEPSPQERAFFNTPPPIDSPLLFAFPLFPFRLPGPILFLSRNLYSPQQIGRCPPSKRYCPDRAIIPPRPDVLPPFPVIPRLGVFP